MSWAGIFVNRESAIPLHRQVASAIREAILRGKLVSGERLLSSRELQAQLSVSRNTVVDALAQLHCEGYLVSVRGVGTFVAQHVNRRGEGYAKLGVLNVLPTPAAQAYIESEPLIGDPVAVVPFRPGIPAVDLFPSAQLKRCFRFEDWTPELLDYPDDLGYMPLRETIARRLRQARGVTCTAEQILITSGAQAALNLIGSALLQKGDIAIVEDPGYPNLRAILQAQGADIASIAVDGEGIDPDAFPRNRVVLAYVSPSHQYPSGAVLALERRFALLEWAEKNDAWIVEDDYDSEFNYTGYPQPALHGLADGRRVIFVGTFSKILSPALRLGYIVVPPELRRAFKSAQKIAGGAQNTILQCALARFMHEGHLARHIAKMRKVYDERRRFVSEYLTQAGKGIVRVRDSRAGLHFIAAVPDELDDVAASGRARSMGVVAPPLSAYFHGARAQRGFIIGFACAPPAVAREALEILIQAVRSERQ